VAPRGRAHGPVVTPVLSSSTPYWVARERDRRRRLLDLEAPRRVAEKAAADARAQLAVHRAARERLRLAARAFQSGLYLDDVAERRRLARESERLSELDRHVVRCTWCGHWTFDFSPVRVDAGTFRPRVNGAPVRVHRCPTAPKRAGLPLPLPS